MKWKPEDWDGSQENNYERHEERRIASHADMLFTVDRPLLDPPLYFCRDILSNTSRVRVLDGDIGVTLTQCKGGREPQQRAALAIFRSLSYSLIIIYY